MSSKAGPQAETAAKTVTFQPDRTHLLAAAVITAVFVLMIGHAPLYLFWILIFPLVFIYWVLRARTQVSESGIAIRYAFRGNRSLSWDEIAGVAFKRSRSVAVTQENTEHSLPGVTFNSLPLLQEASRGRIPDALTAGRAAVDEKVAVYNRDGESTLLDKEEYARRQAAKAEQQAVSADQPADDVPDTPDPDSRT